MNELFRIINGALRLDTDKVRNYTIFLADKLESAGDVASASHLRKMLNDTDHLLRPTGASTGRSLPVDSESRFPLVEEVSLKLISEPPLVLPPEQEAIVNEFLSIAKSYAQIESLGLANTLALLIYGPPGTGKTRLARHIAVELGLPLYVARLDGLVSSYLGSTSKNIRALFDFAAKNPCILFLDEFDAIAKLRGDSQELGELKRVVNSFIQNLDSLGSQSIIVGATNHPELLDSAIWRRFNFRIEVTLPNEEMRREMWQLFLPPLSYSSKEIDLLVDLTDGFSGSDIHECCLRLKRGQIINKKHPEFKQVFYTLKNLALDGNGSRFLVELKNLDAPSIASYLRNRNPKLYSLNSIAELIGISKATAHRLTKQTHGKKAPIKRKITHKSDSARTRSSKEKTRKRK